MADVRAIARLSQIRERFKKAMNMKIITDKSGHGFQFRLPGFKYDDFDRAGNVSPARLNKMMESFRFISESKFTFTVESGSSASLYYLLGNHLVISDLLYRKAAINIPLRFDGRPIGIGKTSMDHYHRLFIDPTDQSSDMRFYVPKEENFLASRILRMVCVDRVSQEPITIPEDVRAVISEAARCASEYGAVSEFPKVKLPSSPPDGAFSFELSPRFSDMDCYFHLNQGAYVEFCLEAAARACTAGALSKFGKQDMCFRKLQTATGLYSLEMFPHQKVNVSVWEDPADPTVALYFVVKRAEDGQLAYRSRYVFQLPEEEN